MSAQITTGYSGDISVQEALSILERDKTAVLVDVRTKAEWAYVGVPDLSALGKRPLLIEWQEFPSMKVNGDFATQLDAVLRDQSVSGDAPLLFLCRSGARSRAAAIAMHAAGHARCFNIANGFEGPLDDKSQRGRVDGWKAQGLPWSQS
jgi:rhodanese-related sulfurtransferase